MSEDLNIYKKTYLLINGWIFPNYDLHYFNYFAKSHCQIHCDTKFNLYIDNLYFESNRIYDYGKYCIPIFVTGIWFIIVIKMLLS